MLTPDSDAYPVLSLVDGGPAQWVGRNHGLPDGKRLSRQHCQFWRADGVIFMQDGSSCGTWLNGSRVEKAQPVTLRPGDVVSFPAGVDVVSPTYKCSAAKSAAGARGVSPLPRSLWSRASMDPLAALLSERSPQQLSATELHSRIALLEDAARAYRAELESRTTTLDALPDELQQLIFGQLCNALDPRAAVAYSSASKGLREPMQRVGEGAGKSPLVQLKEENAAAAALCLKMGVWSCKALREAKEIELFDQGLSATDLATLGKLTPVLPALETLYLDEEEASAGPDGGQLVEGLAVGALLPAVTIFVLDNVGVGDAGASTLATALDRGTLPRLKHLALINAAIGDAGLLALAPALRRRPVLERLHLSCNPFGDEGLAALVAPPPADAPPPQAEALARLKELDLGGSQITDAGCAHLASRLRSGALPALGYIGLEGVSASEAAVEALYGARPRLLG